MTISLEFPFRPESDYFSDVGHQQVFHDYRLQRRMANMGSRPPPFWTQNDEMQLVDSLWMDWFGEHYGGASWPYEDLNLDKLEVKPVSRRQLTPFKIQYETYNEIKLRLLNTVISIKGHPFIVNRIYPKNGTFLLGLSDGSKIWSINYNDITDLRSIPPMYVMVAQTGWLCRSPGKVYQQGLNRHNTILQTVDGTATICGLDVASFVKTFNKRETRQWCQPYGQLMQNGELPAMRLSDDVAVKANKENIIACYKGRGLGKLQDNEVFVFDEDDLLQEWIEKSVQEVGLQLRA